MKIESEELKRLIRGRSDLNELWIKLGFHTKKREIIRREMDWVLSMIKKVEDAEAMKAEHMPNYKIDLNLYDEEDIYQNCTVQVLHNSITDEYSVGWRENLKGVEDE